MAGSPATLVVDDAGMSTSENLIVGPGTNASNGVSTLVIGAGRVDVGLDSLGVGMGSVELGPVGVVDMGVVGQAAGFLNAQSVTGTGPGGVLHFNQNDAVYYFTHDGGEDGRAVDILGHAKVVQQGSGLTILKGVGSYTGGTEVKSGTLIQGAANALPNHTPYAVAAGGTLQLHHDLIMSSLEGQGRIENGLQGSTDPGAITLTVNQSGSSLFEGVIEGAGSFRKTGEGILRLTGGNLFEEMHLSGGETILGDSGSTEANVITIGGASVSIGDDAILDNQSDRVQIGGGGQIFLVDNGKMLIDDVLGQGTGTLEMSGDALLQFGVSGSSAGTLNAAAIHAAAPENPLLAIPKVVFNQHDDFHFTHDGTASGQAVALSGSLAVEQSGAGTTTLYGTNTNTGGTTVDDGTLIQGGADALSSDSALSLSGGRLELRHSLTVSSLSGNGGDVFLEGGSDGSQGLTVDQSTDSTFDGTLSGSGSLYKSGSGTLTLAGNNTYEGFTVVSVGTLLVNNTEGSATSDGPVFTVANTTVGGSGRIGGMLQVSGGAALAPGNSPGTLTIHSLELFASSRLEFELDQPGVPGGGINDLVVVETDLQLDGILEITALDNFGAGTYTLFTYGGTLDNGGLEMASSNPANFNYLVDYSSPGEINLVVTAVPEPTTMLLLLLAAAGLLLPRRRS